MSRLRRIQLSDRFFFITCNLSRTRHNLDELDLGALARAVKSARQSDHFLLAAWVFLPDHWHAIFYPRYPLTISELMKNLKQRATYEVGQHRGKTGSLFQPRFFDRVIRTVRGFNETVEYIHRNPVNRELVREPEDWKWSSIHSYGGPGPVVIPIDEIRLPAEQTARI